MTSDSPTCHLLQRAITRGVVRHTLFHGPGAPLIFLWVLGVGAFTAVWTEPALAVTWTILAATFGSLTIRDQLRRTAAQRLVLRSYAARRFPTQAIAHADVRVAVSRGVALFVEIAAKALEIHRARGADRNLDQALADADELVALQLQSAQQAEELDRILRVAITDGTAPVLAETALSGCAGGADDAACGVAREAAGARHLVDQVGLQLQVLLLHVAQLDRRAGDLVQSAHVTHRAEETLGRLRRVVAARRAAAAEAIHRWLPPLPAGRPTLPRDRLSTQKH
jgi:hypothetical protein